MTTHPTLEQRAKELLDDLCTECKCEECITTAIRHITSFVQESANAASEAMRDECLKLICRYQSLHPEWVQELIGKVVCIYCQRIETLKASAQKLHTHAWSNLYHYGSTVEGTEVGRWCKDCGVFEAKIVL